MTDESWGDRVGRWKTCDLCQRTGPDVARGLQRPFDQMPGARFREVMRCRDREDCRRAADARGLAWDDIRSTTELPSEQQTGEAPA